MAYGSRVARQGRSRLASAYHDRRESCTHLTNSGVGCRDKCEDRDCRAICGLWPGRLRLALHGRSLLLYPVALAHTRHQQRFSTLLPAQRIRSGQVFTLQPITGISQHMSSHTLGIHNVVIEIRIAGCDPWYGDFWHKIFTPRHGYVPSLRSIYCPALPGASRDAFPCDAQRARVCFAIIPHFFDFHQ